MMRRQSYDSDDESHPMRCLCARSKVQVAPSHKAQEPTAAEWDAAAEYTLTLSLPEGWQRHGEQSTELRLAVDYSGDAARIYYKDRACARCQWPA